MNLGNRQQGSVCRARSCCDRAALRSPRHTSLPLLILFVSIGQGAEPDISRLPPPVQQQVDFTADIQPILEHACLRCHGPEKRGGGFRLDSRETALRGGDSGTAILPGDSAGSSLIHFVAGLVEDMTMPPKGKGDPLTAAQIALLRAWIDQGAEWPDNPATFKPRFSVSPAIQWIGVDGNERRFREHYRQREGWSGGAMDFEMEQTMHADTRLRLQGHALAQQEDYRVELELKRMDVGFMRGGYREFRTWFNDVGGFYEPFGLAAPALNRDLHVDTGRAWVDFGLTLPDWPRMTLGYEYQFKEGARSTLQWGGVTAGGVTKSIFPAYKEVDEQTHVLKFDMSHEWRGLRMEDSFRGEWHDARTSRINANFATFDIAHAYHERFRYFQGANALTLEKQARDWLFLSGGYLFSRLSGDGSFQQVAFAPSTGVMAIAPSDATPLAVLRSSSHVFNLGGQLGPWDGLAFTTAVQGSWTRTEGFGNGSVFGFPVRSAHTYGSDMDRAVLEQRLGVRYDRIPFTVLFADAKLRQEGTGQFERELIDDGFGTDKDYLRNTDATGRVKEFRGGFSVSPHTAVTFTTSYRKRDQSDDYNHRTDTDLSGTPGNGYPALLLARDETSDAFEARLAWRTTRWLRTTLKYQFSATEFLNLTAPAATFFPAGGAPGGRLLAGKYDEHLYSLNATLTPWKRLHLNATINYSDTRQISGVNDGVAIVPFEGGTWSVISSGTFVVDNRTDFTLTHSFSRADFGQSNTASLPLGLNFSMHGIQAGLKRRIRDNVRAGLQYLFQHYDERNTGGFNNYTANGIFATMTWELN